jgi:hypothetical protein
LKILAIGDVIGKPGRRAVQQFLPGLINEFDIKFVVANGENSAHGIGITANTARELHESGVDVITTGNHIWAQREMIQALDGDSRIIRPLNFPPTAPGRGYIVIDNVMVVNLIGRVFIGQSDCPFRSMDSLLSTIRPLPKTIIVDFHAEATSEKVALGRYLDGRISALVGTHTHIGTTDAHVLPKGTAYVTDIGMVGPVDSIIGDDVDNVLNSFLTGLPHRLSVGKGRVAFDAMLLDIDDETGKAHTVQRVRREEPEA